MDDKKLALKMLDASPTNDTPDANWIRENIDWLPKDQIQRLLGILATEQAALKEIELKYGNIPDEETRMSEGTGILLELTA